MVFAADIITPDGMLYIKVARLIGDGNWKGVYQEGFYSAYPFLIVVFQKVFHDWETAGRMVSALAGSAAVLPFFLLLRRMFDVKIAAVAAIFFVVSPRLVEYSSDVLREPLFWCFSIASLWAAWKGIDEEKWWFVVLASFFVGLSSFTRTEGLALVAIILLWMVWSLLYQRRKVRLWLAFVMVFLIAFPAIFIAPLYFLKSRAGDWELGHGVRKIPSLMRSANVALPADAGGTTPLPGEEASLLTKIMRNRYVFSAWETSYKYLRSFHVVLIMFLLFGVIRRRTIPYSGKEVPLLIWCSVFFLVSFVYAFKVSYVSTRHGLLMGIPSLLWVSAGFWEFSSRIARIAGRSRWSRKLTRHIAVYLLILACISILPKTLSSAGDGKIEMKMAGIQLKRMGYSDRKFAVEPRINRLTFYKGGEFVNIPVNIDHSALGQFLETVDASYLVVDDRTIETSVRGFKAHTKAMHLERVGIPELEDFREYSFVLYRICR
ncbi:MAG: glycosyltransferase family 39 protein [Syntrophorhabdus sp.]|nr:glycosyltransferase family 39 protein [Syntrophorhabdus sp.]